MFALWLLKLFSSAKVTLSENLGDVSTEDLKTFKNRFLIYLYACTFTIFLVSFFLQKTYLDLTLRVLQHSQTRRYLLLNILYPLCMTRLASPLLLNYPWHRTVLHGCAKEIYLFCCLRICYWYALGVSQAQQYQVKCLCIDSFYSHFEREE